MLVARVSAFSQPKEELWSRRQPCPLPGHPPRLRFQAKQAPRISDTSSHSLLPRNYAPFLATNIQP